MSQINKRSNSKKGRDITDTLILQELKKIQDGSLTVIMQDNYPIQINTYSRCMKVGN